MKDSFEALLHRCSLTATDLVSLSLPEPASSQLQQALGVSDAGQLPPCPWHNGYILKFFDVQMRGGGLESVLSATSQ